MRLVKIPDDGIVRIPIMEGNTTVGERRFDLSFLPAVDAVEVVRCGECIHRTSYSFGMICVGRQRDFFCANGERRDPK